MHTPVETGSAGKLRGSSALRFSKRSTTTTIVRGARLTTAKSIGSFARERHQHFQAKKVSLAERWAKRLSSLKALRTMKPSILFTARFTAQAGSWAGWKHAE